MGFLDRDKITTFLKEDVRRAFNSPTILIMCLLTGSAVFGITNWVYSKNEVAQDNILKAIKTEFDTIQESTKLKYEGIAKEYEIRLENKEDVIEYKSSLVSEYRERLGLIPADGNPYSKLTHKELKNKTLELVDKIWPFCIEYKEKEKAISNEWQNQSMNMIALSPEKQREQWDLFMSKSNNLRYEYQTEFTREYSKQFYSDVLLLREEIISRMPKDIINTLDLASWSKSRWMLQSPAWTQELLQEMVMLAKRLESEQ